MIKNKGLVRYEWKKVKILAFALLCCGLIAWLALDVKMEQMRNNYESDFQEIFNPVDAYGPYNDHFISFNGLLSNSYNTSERGSIFGIAFYSSLYMTTMFFVLGAFLLAAVEFAEEKLPSGEDFLYSLPVTRKMLIKNRIRFSLLTLGAAFGLYSLGVLLVQHRNANWINKLNLTTGYFKEFSANENMRTTAAALLLCFLVIVTVYFICLLFQTMSNSMPVAAAVSFLVFWFPLFLGNTINNLCIRFGGFVFPLYEKVINKLMNPTKFFAWDCTHITDSASQKYIAFWSLTDMVPKFLMLIILIVVCWALSRLFYEKTYASSEGIFRKKWLNRAFQLIFSVSCGLFVTRVYNSGRYGFWPLMCGVVLVSLCIYACLNRFIGMGRRRKENGKI
ncbi:hypothetical protein [Anaerolentibacter hominis]|uniref:hypothetical protein n=1 Tax=Anaerolentibacter hominis TaxID=3079009 RepID=UPI0031B7F482